MLASPRPTLNGRTYLQDSLLGQFQNKNNLGLSCHGWSGTPIQRPASEGHEGSHPLKKGHPQLH